MNSLEIFRHLINIIVLAIAITAAVLGCAQDNAGSTPQNRATSGTANTVTHNEPPRSAGDLTPEEMRAAKPFPMPSVKGSPVPQQTTPNPFAEPPGSSLPWLGKPLDQ
jgi:hypothetical protein